MSNSVATAEDFKNGVRVITTVSWRDFREQAEALETPKRGFVWRGQTKDWPLRPSFDRKSNDDTPEERLRKLAAHLENFRKKMDSEYPNVLPSDELAAWALGQHYDLKTPLLDWTANTYIAAYFAFVKRADPNDPNDHYRYVYALNRSIERLISKLKIGNQVLSTQRSVPFIDELNPTNPRFKFQQGVFTNQLHGKSIEEFVKSLSNKRPDDLFLVKFRLPTEFRDECLRDLSLMKIDHISLLLDLRSVVDDCNKIL